MFSGELPLVNLCLEVGQRLNCGREAKLAGLAGQAEHHYLIGINFGYPLLQIHPPLYSHTASNIVAETVHLLTHSLL